MARFLCGGRSALRLPDLANEYEIEWITHGLAAVRTFKDRFSASLRRIACSTSNDVIGANQPFVSAANRCCCDFQS
jgi:hypothetical protein